MGKVEKIVVLSVLFLITLILVVSLSSSVEERDGQAGNEVARAAEPAVLAGPASAPAGRDEARRQVDAAVPAPAERAQPTAPVAERPGTLLDSSVQGDAPASATAPAATPTASALPAGSILVTDAGLLPSYLDDYRFYAWRQGDTWEAVAARYLVNGREGLLRRANEGRERVAPGEKILVPVFDLGGASEPVRTPLAAGSSAVPTSAVLASAAARPAASGTGYTVQEGDSLWRIAKKVYGEGSRWQAIFDANRDVLPTADDLAPGQTLRIP